MHQPENVHVDMVHHDRDEPERLTGLFGASLVSDAASHDGQISMQHSDAKTMRSTRMRRFVDLRLNPIWKSEHFHRVIGRSYQKTPPNTK